MCEREQSSLQGWNAHANGFSFRSVGAGFGGGVDGLRRRQVHDYSGRRERRNDGDGRRSGKRNGRRGRKRNGRHGWG